MKDWMQAAAEEIGSEVVHDHLIDGIKTIRMIISKHSPFEPDTAYMPVPRCETCKHLDGIYCEVLQSVPSGSRIPSEIKQFGCVRWEAK
jgi:hypothetical protein